MPLTDVFRDTEIEPETVVGPISVGVGAFAIGIRNIGVAPGSWSVPRTGKGQVIAVGDSTNIPMNPFKGYLEAIDIDGTGTTLEVIIVR